MRALVIVDAWSNWPTHVMDECPTLYDEVHSFGVFLNEVCKIERKKGTQIIHSGGTRHLPMEEIEIFPQDWILKSPNDLKKRAEKYNFKLNEVYFCGFHFGHCVPYHAKGGMGEGANIILNLSLLTPQYNDKWNSLMKRDSTFHYFLWSQNGIEEISIK